LVPRVGDDLTHATACHFPVESPEEMVTSRPNISEDERVVEPELVSKETVEELTETTERGRP
jgi:hypothetical protein